MNSVKYSLYFGFALTVGDALKLYIKGKIHYGMSYCIYKYGAYNFYPHTYTINCLSYSWSNTCPFDL